jgi:hypothetical protein
MKYNVYSRRDGNETDLRMMKISLGKIIGENRGEIILKHRPMKKLRPCRFTSGE